MRSIIALLIVITLASACNLSADPSAASGEATIAPTKTLVSSTVQPATDDSQPTSSSATIQPVLSDCAPQSDWDVYTVQRGDNLTRIANQTNSTVDELIAANCLDNPNSLRSGQQLYVPNNPSQPTQGNASATNKTHSGSTGFVFDYPETWYVTEIAGDQPRIVVTSYAYVEGDDVPINEWTDTMVNLTMQSISDTDEPGTLEEWVTRSRLQLSNAANITSIGQAQRVATTTGIVGRMIEYSTGEQTHIQTYFFVINDHKLQINIWGNFSLATQIIQSLRVS